MADKWLDDEELYEILGVKPNQDEEKEHLEYREETTNVPKKAVETHPVKFEEFNENDLLSGEFADFEMLYDIPLEVRVLLGSAERTIEQILELEEGSILPTERLAGEPVEIIVAEQVIAKGEIVIIDDKFGVLITEIVPPRERIKSVEGKLKRQK